VRNTGRAISLFAGPLARVAALVLVAGPAAASEGGLEIMPDPRTLLILLVAFGLLIWPVHLILFKPLFRVLDERDRRISGAQERAEALGREADAILQRYEDAVRQAREETEGHRRTALEGVRKEHRERTSAARTAAEAEFARTREEIGIALDEARGALRDEAQALARVAAERILGRSFA
jgi:F-type H+-transporting ATPase subunit b